MHANDTYRKRQEALRRYLRENDIHAALIEDTEGRRHSGLRYLTGHPSDAILLVFADSRTVLVPWDMNLANERATADEIRPYTDFERRFISAVTGIMKEAGRSAEVLELSEATPYLQYQEISNAMPSLELRCGRKGLDERLRSVRMIKDEAEVQATRRAAEITSTVLHRVLDGFRRGAFETELDVAFFIQREGRQLGADGMGFETLVASPKRSVAIHPVPAFTNAPLAGPGLTIVDFGFTVDGYTADVTLTVAQEPLSDEQRLLFELVQRAYHEVAVPAIRPGASSRKITQAVVDFFASHDRNMPHALGHGIGLDAHEAPTFRTRADSDYELQPGMIVAIEPGLYSPTAGGARLENDFLITEAGAECLTTSSVLTLPA